MLETRTVEKYTQNGNVIKAGEIVYLGSKQFTVVDIIDSKQVEGKPHLTDWTLRVTEVQTEPSKKELSGV